MQCHHNMQVHVLVQKHHSVPRHSFAQHSPSRRVYRGPAVRLRAGNGGGACQQSFFAPPQIVYSSGRLTGSE